MHRGGVFGLAFAAITHPAVVRAITCDGSELLCMDLTDASQVSASGGENAGGDFAANGYQPSDRGGLQWSYGPEYDLSTGRFEVDITGLLPNMLDEGSGGKVSFFELCGLDADADQVIGLQKMPFDYHEGNNLRYYYTGDGLAGGSWDAAIITSRDLGCFYSIADPVWSASETHHIVAEWSPDAISLRVDGFTCNARGSGRPFDATRATFTLGNRCARYSNQHAPARFRDFKLFASRRTTPRDSGTPDLPPPVDVAMIDTAPEAAVIPPPDVPMTPDVPAPPDVRSVLDAGSTGSDAGARDAASDARADAASRDVRGDDEYDYGDREVHGDCDCHTGQGGASPAMAALGWLALLFGRRSSRARKR